MRKVLTIVQGIICIMGIGAWAAAGDDGGAMHVISHDRTLVVTDPTTGTNPVREWGVFPPSTTEYRKAVLYVTYECPDGLHCGEWDYIDNIYLRRVGGQEGPSKDLEIARMISPYGWRFGATWGFTWHVDITDFAWLLHDSVEVEFLHGGYESNTDRGWLITLDFELTEGRPAMACVGMERLWEGVFAYGDTSRPIEEALKPIAFSGPAGAEMARVRILQTGHGMDDRENCAEFCSKYRRITLNDTLVSERQVWRACGDNPLYPQAGTWIFNRANWCPGSIVFPDLLDLAVTPGSANRLEMEMEPYTNTGNPTANYSLSSYLFYYAAPWAANDVSLEEIIVPGVADEYSRLNPACSTPRLLVKNCSREAVTSMVVKYGDASAPQSFEWTGWLSSQQLTEIRLPGTIDAGKQFFARLEGPNGGDDEYPADNERFSETAAVPAYGTEFVLALRSNRDSTHNGYRLTDETGQVVREREIGTLGGSALYSDTLRLTPGCYELVVTDTSGDGLDFWLNPDGGYGYVRILDLKGRLLKAFLSDFGSEIRHSFAVAEGAVTAPSGDELPLVTAFPARNKGLFTIDYFDNEPGMIRIEVLTEDSSRTVYRDAISDARELMIPVDISAEPDGVYFVRVVAGDRVTTRRIRVKHQD